jgi:hypothetical protein
LTIAGRAIAANVPAFLKISSFAFGAAEVLTGTEDLALCAVGADVSTPE